MTPEQIATEKSIGEQLVAAFFYIDEADRSPRALAVAIDVAIAKARDEQQAEIKRLNGWVDGLQKTTQEWASETDRLRGAGMGIAGTAFQTVQQLKAVEAERDELKKQLSSIREDRWKAAIEIVSQQPVDCEHDNIDGTALADALETAANSSSESSGSPRPAQESCNCLVPGIGKEYRCDDANATPFPSHCPCICHQEDLKDEQQANEAISC